MIKAENSNIYNNATWTKREAVMLLRLRRPLRDATKYCAFENIRIPTKTDQESQGKTIGFRKLARKLKSTNFCLSCKRKLVNRLLVYGGIIVQEKFSYF
jgi:hypothetical protein